MAAGDYGPRGEARPECDIDGMRASTRSCRDRLRVLFEALIGASAMTHIILAEVTASVSELKKNPMGTVAAGEGFPVAILNRNEPVFYCVPAKAFEAMMDIIEDKKLNAIANSRRGQRRIRVKLDEL
jgi:antitoxin StbD